MVILGIVALVIDSSTQQIVVRHIQNAADAAALAGAQEFNGEAGGWLAAKRAAVRALKENPITGATAPIDEGFTFIDVADPACVADVFETDNNYKCTEGRSGNIVVTVERGAYWSAGEGEDGEADFQFISFEGQGRINDMWVYVQANAVRVSVVLSGLKTSFGRVLGSSQFEAITRVGTATYDHTLEPCVLPLAVSLCDVMLNTSPAAQGAFRYKTPYYDSTMQCQREILAMEGDPEIPDREQGLIRSYYYPRLPYVRMYGAVNQCKAEAGYDEGDYPNCKAIPIRAVLGVPTNDPLEYGTPARPREVAEVLKGDKRCIKASLGARFRPMDDALEGGIPIDGENGFLQNAPGSAFETTLVNLINSGEGNVSFSEVFYNDPLTQTSPKPNFPHLRRLKEEFGEDVDRKNEEVLVNWPLSGGTGEMLLESMDNGVPPYEWRNPACATSGVTGSSVRPVQIMVITPSAPDAQYCDFERLFTGQEPNADLLKVNTGPKIVGFLKAYLFDFHIAGHTVGEDIPNDRNPFGVIVPRRLLRFFRKVKDYLRDHRDYFDCEGCEQCEEFPCGDVDAGQPECRPTSYCQEDPCDDDCDPPPALPAALDYLEGCFDTFASLGLDGYDFENPEQYEQYQIDVDELLDGVGLGLALPNTHCVPMKENGCFPTDNWSCWDPLEDRAPQYLCGALRLRLDCDDEQTLPSPVTLTEARPTLVD